MRLTCPNCDAQYEVPDDVIPQDGRDVQCSNCGNTWFQVHPDQAASIVDDPELPEPDSEWTPEVSDDEPLQEAAADEVKEAESEERSGPVTMSADAPDEVLAAAVKAAIKRARPDQAAVEEPEEAPEQDEASFEADLDATLAELPEEEPEAAESDEPPAEDAEDSVYYEPAEEAPEEPAEEPVTAEPKRRTIDPTVANILQEEAALEAERRSEETTLESQPDLGLEETQDDAAKRARQARERMARMRGLPADAADKPVEPIPANSRRDLLPDIEEINSTLRATEDRAPDEQPDGRPTVSQRRAGGSRIGFALAFLLIGLFSYVYNRPESVSTAIPAAENYVAAFVNFVDNARIWLDSQTTKLMIWLDGLSSE